MPHDFFLSYACVDNAQQIPGRSNSEWVTTFHASLLAQLQHQLGRKASVFFDRRDLSGNSALTPAIEAALDDSHLFVAVSSEAYYKRTWCKLERQRFIQRLGQNPAAAKRVFVIHNMAIQQEVWQGEFFPDLPGYSFFRESNGRLLALGAPALDVEVADASSYFQEIFRVAQDMASRIRELEGTVAPVAPAPFAPERSSSPRTSFNLMRSGRNCARRCATPDSRCGPMPA